VLTIIFPIIYLFNNPACEKLFLPFVKNLITQFI
jgi:hypothetical protein